MSVQRILDKKKTPKLGKYQQAHKILKYKYYFM